MNFDQNLHSAPKTFPAHLAAPASLDTDNAADAADAITAFEDRLWSAAEAVIASGAPNMAVVATAASLVRRQSEMFASIISSATYMKSLGKEAGLTCGDGLTDDIAATQNRLIRRLQQDLSKS